MTHALRIADGDGLNAQHAISDVQFIESVVRPNRQSGTRYLPEETPRGQICCVNSGRWRNEGQALGGQGDLLVAYSQAPLAIVRLGATKSPSRALTSSATDAAIALSF
jgi:hypothetical protein